MSDEQPRSTDFPGHPFGPGDTISYGDAVDLDALEELEIPATDLLELEHQAPELADADDTSRTAAAQHDDTEPPTTGGLTIYRVTAPTKIFGHEPGAIFAAAIQPDQERRLIERGQLEVAKSSGRPARPAGATAPGTTTTGGSTP